MKNLNFLFSVMKLGATETVKFHFFFVTLGTIVIWQNHYIKTIILNGFVTQVRGQALLGLHAFHHNWAQTLFQYSSFGMFYLCFNGRFNKVIEFGRLTISHLGTSSKSCKSLSLRFILQYSNYAQSNHKHLILTFVMFTIRGLYFCI